MPNQNQGAVVARGNQVSTDPKATQNVTADRVEEEAAEREVAPKGETTDPKASAKESKEEESKNAPDAEMQASEESVEMKSIPKTPQEVAQEATTESIGGSDLYGGNGEVGKPPAAETRKFSMDAPYTDIARQGGHEYSYHRPDYVGE